MGTQWIWFGFLRTKSFPEIWEGWYINEGPVHKGSSLKNGRNTERGGKKWRWRLLIVTEDTLFFPGAVLPGAVLPVRWACPGPNMPNLGSLYIAVICRCDLSKLFCFSVS